MTVLMDIADMPGFNVDGPQNGIRSVSAGLVEFGAEPRYWRSIPTARCVRHGACNCVARTKTGRIYRCPTCNEGAYRPDVDQTNLRVVAP